MDPITRTLPARLRARAAAMVALVLLAGAPTAVAVSQPEPAFADSGISQHMGVDACGLYSVSKAQAFWNNTPYWNFGLYIGGSSAGCPMNSASFVSSLRSMGWKLMPLWVGPQAPCTSYSSRFSYDLATARSQGQSEAASAYNRLLSLGMTTLDTPVTYDLENFNTGNSSCLAAARSFIQGWVEQMHIPPAQKAGVYGSACASGLSSFATIANPPDFIAGADWDGIKNVWDMACVSTGSWVYHQRHKQYRGDHNETWNGVTVSVDNDCSDGPVYPAPDNLGNTQGCLG